MKKRTYLIVGLLLCFSAAVASARLWYRQDIQWGTQHTTTSDSLPLDAVNASVIPLTTGSNVEATLTSLQSQVNALTAALALKAPLASPAFTGTPTFSGSLVLPVGTSIGTVTGTEIARLAGVTSGIQTQINAKAAASNATITGTLTVSGEISALQFKSSGGDNTHFAHLGNQGDITIPATDNAGIIWFNSTMAKWRIYDGSSIDNLAVEP